VGNVIAVLPPLLDTGDRFPPPVAVAVVNVVLLAVAQVVAAPPAFLGAMYQLYNVPAVKPVAL